MNSYNDQGRYTQVMPVCHLMVLSWGGGNACWNSLPSVLKIECSFLRWWKCLLEFLILMGRVPLVT